MVTDSSGGSSHTATSRIVPCLRARIVALACGVVLGGLLAGCGSTSHPRPHPPSKPRATVDGCLGVGASARRLVLRLGAGTRSIPAVVVGRGETAVVLTNESDEDLCSWVPFARVLAAHGYAALLYDYLDPTQLPVEVRAAARAALGAGAWRVVLMGASVGARASIEAAASAPAGVTGVVSLSAEQTVASDGTDLARIARHVTLPALLIAAREDPIVGGFTPALLRALASGEKRALILPGVDHGTALLSGTYGRSVQAAILRFVARLTVS